MAAKVTRSGVRSGPHHRLSSLSTCGLNGLEREMSTQPRLWSGLEFVTLFTPRALRS